MRPQCGSDADAVRAQPVRNLHTCARTCAKCVTRVCRSPLSHCRWRLPNVNDRAATQTQFGRGKKTSERARKVFGLWKSFAHLALYQQFGVFHRLMRTHSGRIAPALPTQSGCSADVVLPHSGCSAFAERTVLYARLTLTLVLNTS